ncbi:bacillithiol biosynthesis deacetylase BshB2 [Bacillus methanolicus]|uniref:bacillithiol biosynthesis deacetylase BshB2 n=1 Tax=Bacillus methanolicus TaxID=1471 RepID=UPI0023808E99|nr:bacillithiol biosynthesis deacetylase BshB2 [Bacillus methanolicus]MDE3840383.1 bacillithiol biosynthesis deacetylase BshB2 [Bacillus methanolicus]
MEKERQILIVFPHPDDEAFGVSGTIASYTRNGTPVTYACLTLGEMGRNMGNPPFANRESLPKIRKQELQEAAKILGIQDLRMMGLRDKTIEFEDEEKLTNMVSSLIEEVNPSLIITFYPGYSVHPDHEATGAAVVRAVERIPEQERPKLHCVAFSNNCEEELGPPDIVNDVSAVKEVKMKAMKAHKSQTQLMTAEMEEKLKKNDPQVLAWLQYERFWTYKFSAPTNTFHPPL